MKEFDYDMLLMIYGKLQAIHRLHHKLYGIQETQYLPRMRDVAVDYYCGGFGDMGFINEHLHYIEYVLNYGMYPPKHQHPPIGDWIYIMTIANSLWDFLQLSKEEQIKILW